MIKNTFTAREMSAGKMENALTNAKFSFAMPRNDQWTFHYNNLNHILQKLN